MFVHNEVRSITWCISRKFTFLFGVVIVAPPTLWGITIPVYCLLSQPQFRFVKKAARTRGHSARAVTTPPFIAYIGIYTAVN